MRVPLFGVLGLVACTEYEVNPKSDPALNEVEEGECDLVVDPEKINFGKLNVGEPARYETVTVSNEGDAACQIESLTLEDPTQPFELSSIGSVLISAGASTTFTVSYEPVTAAESSTKILVNSNDPAEGTIPVTVTGEGIAPVIVIDPEAYDFGSTWIGCDHYQDVTISNVGKADLIVSEFDYITASNDLLFDANEDEGTETEFDGTEQIGNGALPWTLAEGASKTVRIYYSPLDDYPDEAFLTVHSNDPLHSAAQASQVGNASIFGENLDVFEQPLKSATDLLFIIDNSCSMAEEQISLSDNFNTFINTLVLTDADYQIGVITTDNPSFRGDIITADGDPVADFIAQANPGIGGSGDEQGNEMAYQSLQPGGDAGPGSEFLRDDAMLLLIFVTDEVDNSRSAWSDYVNYYWTLKEDSDNVVAHAIAGDYPSGCATAGGPGIGYYETVSAMGGLYLSVCATDWASHLESIAEVASADLSSFELTDQPVPESIVVRIDGVATTVGWEYNVPDRAVDFDDDHIPPGGSTIEIEYALVGDCTR